jgi:pectate lyase
MGGNYKSGIDIQCSNVTIEDGINFTNFWHNPVHIHGSDSNHLSNITIKNCIIDSTLETDGDTLRNCAAIRSAHAENVWIHNCTITQRNQNAQVDGIFADSTINLKITNSKIILEDNEHFLQHLDCIQITNDCSNVTIENNYIENASTQIDKNRQGIYITKT